MTDQILTLAQAAEIVPLSKSTLYRVAEQGGPDSPFRKRGGRWLTTESDLLEWVRTGHKPMRVDPMSRPVRGSVDDLLQEVHQMRRAA
jgi:excisionase family DNA binding protein